MCISRHKQIELIDKINEVLSKEYDTISQQNDGNWKKYITNSYLHCLETSAANRKSVYQESCFERTINSLSCCLETQSFRVKDLYEKNSFNGAEFLFDHFLSYFNSKKQKTKNEFCLFESLENKTIEGFVFMKKQSSNWYKIFYNKKENKATIFVLQGNFTFKIDANPKDVIIGENYILQTEYEYGLFTSYKLLAKNEDCSVGIKKWGQVTLIDDCDNVNFLDYILKNNICVGKIEKYLFVEKELLNWRDNCLIVDEEQQQVYESRFVNDRDFCDVKINQFHSINETKFGLFLLKDKFVLSTNYDLPISSRKQIDNHNKIQIKDKHIYFNFKADIIKRKCVQTQAKYDEMLVCEIDNNNENQYLNIFLISLYKGSGGRKSKKTVFIKNITNKFENLLSRSEEDNFDLSLYKTEIGKYEFRISKMQKDIILKTIVLKSPLKGAHQGRYENYHSKGIV